MITKEKGSHNVVFNCDGCSETFDTETYTWADAVELVKEEGWTIQKTGEDERGKNEWSHWCPICGDK